MAEESGSRAIAFCRPSVSLPNDALSTPTQASRLKVTPGVSSLPVWLSYSASSLKITNRTFAVSMAPVWLSNSLSSRKMTLRPLSPIVCVPVRPQRLPLNQATRGVVTESPLALAWLMCT